MILIKSFFRNYLLPNLVLILLFGIYLITIYFFKFYSVYDEEAPSSFFSYSVQSGQFTVIMELDFDAHIYAVSKEMDFTTTNLSLLYGKFDRKDLKTFCFTQIYFRYTGDKEGNHWAGSNNPNPTPICFDTSQLIGWVDDKTMGFHIPADNLTSMALGSGIGYTTMRNYYPFDSLTSQFAVWVEYSAIFDDGSSEKGVLSPFIKFSPSIDLPIKEFTFSSTEQDQKILIEDNLFMPVEYQNKELFTHYYTVQLKRPFIIQLLFVAVIVTVTGFLVVTFFIKNTEIYLASILVFLFSINNLKQIIPSPEDLAGKVGIFDILLPIFYLLIGVSGINFLIKKYLSSGAQDANPPPSLSKTATQEKASKISGKKLTRKGTIRIKKAHPKKK